jgi:hypothetical protein
MTKCTQKPILHVILSDRDQWAVEAEWPDGTLERVNTFNDHSSAANWIPNLMLGWRCETSSTRPTNTGYWYYR